uniref:AP1/FUL1 n=1 Tax=Cymbidium goeringii TaxID=112607 RepID=A0A1P8SCC1_9ASPA|nr:AP1/FUL1 [Cymbidium goeringii]
MGRGRVQLKRIESKINRQVTFSKRRSGLLKKAHEISVLCDAELALIIFSSRGKLYEYSTGTCMERILEQYERYRYAERALLINESDPQEDLRNEYGYLKSKVDALQRSRSHLLGEKLDTLSLEELQQLEQQLETALKRTRSQMNQHLLDCIAEHQRKEKSLLEQKIALKKKIIESENSIKMLQQMSTNKHCQAQISSSSPPTFQATNSVPTINIGTYLACSAGQDVFDEPLLFG